MIKPLCRKIFLSLGNGDKYGTFIVETQNIVFHLLLILVFLLVKGSPDNGNPALHVLEAALSRNSWIALSITGFLLGIIALISSKIQYRKISLIYNVVLQGSFCAIFSNSGLITASYLSIVLAISSLLSKLKLDNYET